MKTEFTNSQLKDDNLQLANDIIRHCVHCGLCTATCSSYVILKDERDSPRGRIYMIKEMLEGNKEIATSLRPHMDRCLTCLSCMSTCPSGVDYLHLADIAREQIEQNTDRPLKNRLLRQLLLKTLVYPDRMRKTLFLAKLAAPLKPLLNKFGLEEMAAMLTLAPSHTNHKKITAPSLNEKSEAAIETDLTSDGAIPERIKRVTFLSGCAQQTLRPEITQAATALLKRLGIEIVRAETEACCGALHQHLGETEQASLFAKQNIDAWEKLEQDTPLDAILITSSGCGTTVKDYAHIFQADEIYGPKAKKMALKCFDISEYLLAQDLGSPVNWADLKVACHLPCSMKHGQKIEEQPTTLLQNAGYTPLTINESHICCGSAGVYNILQPSIAQELGQRKAGHIDALKPDLVVTGNLGCMMQIATYSKIPILHLVELLNWAYGGNCPKEIETLQSRAVKLPLTEEEPVKSTSSSRLEASTNSQ